jgi:hypothetical protein
MYIDEICPASSFVVTFTAVLTAEYLPASHAGQDVWLTTAACAAEDAVPSTQSLQNKDFPFASFFPN